jgi:geranylgeranyl pyrophosphate synthase
MTTNHLSDEEYFKYGCADQEAVRHYEMLAKRMAELEKENEGLERRYEVVSEQVGFARQLVDDIKMSLTYTGSKKDLIKDINMEIENSMFEL